MMSDTRQWPDNISSGDIRYGRASNYDGFYLADAEHGIPTIGSVADASPVTIRGQHVHVFNYPGQTEAIAKALCDRWNAYASNQAEIARLREALERIASTLDVESYPENGSLESQLGRLARAALEPEP